MAATAALAPFPSTRAAPEKPTSLRDLIAQAKAQTRDQVDATLAKMDGMAAELQDLIELGDAIPAGVAQAAQSAIRALEAQRNTMRVVMDRVG